MAIQSDGKISMLDLVAEFGGTAPHALSEFYGKSTLPKNGKISFFNFYGTSNKLPTEYGYWVNMEEITANKTFTVPSGATRILVAAMGGGASGAWGDSYSDNYGSFSLGGSGGGASAWKVGTFDVTPGQSLAVTIGKGGKVTKKWGQYRGVYHTQGVAGGNTSVGSLITSSGAPAPGMILSASNWPSMVDGSPAGKGINGGGNGARGGYKDDGTESAGAAGTACVSKILEHDESNSYVPPAPGVAPSPGVTIKYGRAGQGGTSPYGPGSVSTYNWNELSNLETPDATNKGSGGGGGNHMGASGYGGRTPYLWAGRPGAGAPGVVKIFWA